MGGREVICLMWVCRRCGRGPWNSKTAPFCLNCGHVFDLDCHRDPVYTSSKEEPSKRDAFTYKELNDDTGARTNAPKRFDQKLGNNLSTGSSTQPKQPVPSANHHPGIPVASSTHDSTNIHQARPQPPTLAYPHNGGNSEYIGDDRVGQSPEQSAFTKYDSVLSPEKPPPLGDMVHEEESDQFSDSSSVFTHASSLDSSTTTSSSLGPGASTVRQEAVDTFAQLLLQDEAIKIVLAEGLETIGLERLEQECRRLVRRFAIDVLQEAENEAQKQLGKMVKRNARSITHIMISNLRQPTNTQPSNLEQWLQSLNPGGKGFPDKPENESTENESTENDSDEDNKLPDTLPRIDQLRAFVFASIAFSKFRAKLDDLVHRKIPQQAMLDGMERRGLAATEEQDYNRASTIEHFLRKICRPLGAMLPPNTISALASFLQVTMRPRIPEGHKRITWICGCGKAMYADVQEAEGGAAARLEQELRRDAAAAAAARSCVGTPIATEGSQPTRETAMVQETHNNVPSSGPTSMPETYGSSSSGAVASQNMHSSVPDPEGDSTPTRQRFLLLCVNGPSYTRWQSIDISGDLDDVKFFDAIRKEYKKLRRSYTRDYNHVTCHEAWKRVLPKLLLCGDLCWDIAQVFFTPKSANFVKFRALPAKNMMIADVHDEPCLPPRQEVVEGRYHYQPCPQDTHNPCLRVPYLHMLWSPGGPHTYNFWTNRTPKKLKEGLRCQNDLEDVTGWGVYIVEGPNYLSLAMMTVVSLISSMVLGLGYALKTHDVSSGFTVASFFLAAEAMVLTMGMTVLITALSHPN